MAASGTDRGYQWAIDNDIMEQWQINSMMTRSSSFKNGVQKRIDEVTAQRDAQMQQYKNPTQPTNNQNNQINNVN